MIIDVEITNRCNATCDFCPRDNMPKMGHMTKDNFYALVDRVTEAAEPHVMSICGTGDPSVHPKFVEFVEYALQRGAAVQVTSNGNRINRDVAQRLLDAGLKKMNFSITGLDETYEKIYNLPFATTRKNVLDFLALADGRCDVFVCLADYHKHNNSVNLWDIKQYWKALGIKHFRVAKVTNRAGAIALNEPVADVTKIRQVLAESKLRGVCPVPFDTYLVGWDGIYYLCSHDWRHEASFGHVKTDSIETVYKRKLEYFSRLDIICHRCNLYPGNVLIQMGDTDTQKVNGVVYSKAELIPFAQREEKNLIDAIERM